MGLEKVTKGLYVIGGLATAASVACGGNDLPVNTQEAEREVTQPAIVEEVQPDFSTPTNELVLDPTIESTLFPEPTHTLYPTATPTPITYPTATTAPTPAITPTPILEPTLVPNIGLTPTPTPFILPFTEDEDFQELPPNKFIATYDEMASFLFSAEMILYEQGQHPATVRINAQLQELGKPPTLDTFITFNPNNNPNRIEYGSFNSTTQKISVDYPKTVHWFINLVNNGRPALLKSLEHELFHYVQFINYDDNQDFKSFISFFSERDLRVFQFEQDDGSSVIGIAPKDYSQINHEAIFYGDLPIFFDTAIPEDVTMDILEKFGQEYGSVGSSRHELEEQIIDTTKFYLRSLAEGKIISESVAYVASNTSYSTIDELITEGIPQSIDDYGPHTSLDDIKQTVELIGQLYGLLEKQGYVGIDLDLEVAKVTGKIYNPLETLSPMERLEQYLDNLRGKEELPDGMDVLQKLLDGKMSNWEENLDQAQQVFGKVLYDQFGDRLENFDITQGYNFTVVSDDSGFHIEFEPVTDNFLDNPSTVPNG